MIYQLPNGKTIHLSIEEYLELTDQDIQYLISVNAGEYRNSPFYDSVLKRNKRHSSDEEEETLEEDRSIDFVPDNEELTLNPIVDDSADEEEWPDFPDDMTSI